MWANNVDTPADTETSAKEIQQQYLELLGCTDWTRFGCGETHLIKQKIAFALFGEPTHLSEDLSDSNEQSTFGFTDLEIKDVIPVYNKICELKKYAADHQSVFMSVIFVCVVPEDSKITDITSCATTLYPSKDIRIVPVFRIRKCIKVDLSDNQKGCCLFVDNIGRVYKNWNLYLENNKLPKGVIVAPKNGFHDGVIMNEEAHVILDLAWSPASSAFAKARTVGNVVSTVVAVGATGILGLSMFTPLGPVVLGTTMAASALTGLYGTAVSTQHIVDRSQHQQSIGLENPEARSSWINIGVSTTGVIAGASSRLLTRAAQTGATIGIGIRAAHDTTIVLATLSSGAGIVNGIFNCIIRYNETKELPSNLEIFQMASSVLFFTNSLITSRMATTIIEETQTGLMNNYRSSLRSNRHRKIFDKLTAESRRLVGRTKGNSEVIKGITRIENRDQFFQNVLRLNKEFNENGVKISFGAGQLLLNNKHVINPQEFYNLNQVDRVSYLTNLEPANTSASNFPTTSTSVNGPSFGVRLTPIISTTFAIQRLVNEFSDMNLSSSDDIIRYIAVKLTDFINNEDIFKKFLFIMKTLEESLNTYMREQLACLGIYGNDILYRIFDFVYNYFKCLCGSDAAIPSVVLNFFYDGQLNPDSIHDLLVYFRNKLNIDYRNTICSPDEKRCCICNGITFSAD